MRFSDLNWFDVENYLENDDRLMIILGACEQHGYLSLLTDANIPQALADAASQKNGVLVAPPLNFGASPYFLAYPGTISLRIAILMDIAEDIVKSVYAQGFRRLLILNGHGGNDPVRGRLYELASQLPDLRLAWYAWWQSHSVEVVAAKHNLKPYHAGWVEAFQFNRVAELPAGEKTPPHVPGLLGADEARQVYGDGVFGGAYQVDEAIMREIFDASLGDVFHLLKFE
ncbi:MAG: creatininase family protein [Chloroflexi bacterium]|jgi:creatinine amidohydrolase|nr:creatininase family protein [Chloroflexota bacterium]